MGIVVERNPIEPDHRDAVIALLAAEGLTDEERYAHFRGAFADCDVLFDKERQRQPSRLWITRCVLWLGASDRLQYEAMAWMKPVLHFAVVDEWDTTSCYGKAATYARVLAHSIA